MKQANNMKKTQGFSLIEALIVLAFIAAAIAGIGIFVTDYQNDNTAKSITEFTSLVRPRILDKHPTEISTLTTATMIDLDFARNYEQTNGGVTTLVVKGTTGVTLAANVAGDASLLTFAGVSEPVCIRAIEGMWNQGPIINVDGTAVKTGVSDTYTARSSTVASECAGGGNSIELTIRNT